jgi:ribosomal protein L40E
MQVLSFFLSFLSYALIVWIILTFRKVKTVSTKSPVIAIAISLVLILVYWLIIGPDDLPPWFLVLILAIGAGLGAYQGRKTKVWSEEGEGKVQSSVWFLVIFAVCYAFSQFLVLLGEATSFTFGLGAMCLGTGVVLGSQGNIFYRVLRMPTKTPTEVKVAEPIRAPPIQEPATTDATKIRYCHKCGSQIPAVDRFCRKCGAQVQTEQQKSG